MATSQTARRISPRLATGQASPNVCLRCQFRFRFPLQPYLYLSPTISVRCASTSTPKKWGKNLLGKTLSQLKRGKVKPSTTSDTGSALDREIDQAEEEAGKYTPALTWDGLPSIGGNQGSKWDREHVWEGFMSTVKLQSREDISAAIYRALVEVFTLQNAGLEPVVKTTVGGDWGVQALSGAKIVQLGDGAVKVDYASEDLREELITVLTSVPEVEAGTLEGEGAVEKESLQESEIGTQNEDVPSQEEQANATEAQEEDVFEPEDPAGDDVAAAVTDTQMGAPVEASKKRAAWLALLDHVPAEQWIKITFADPSVKFAIVKRVMQLTGHRIPDVALQDINSAKSLFGHLVTKPKPKKLAERLTLNEQLLELPNVQLRQRRWTPIDREKEVGRWKVIERELKLRDLPVTGHL